MRVYLPLTLDLLAVFEATGEVPASVDRIAAQDESEESEYAALMTAADASAELLDGSGRRVVLAADVVEEAGAVPRKRWAALHIDTEDRDIDRADPDDDLAWYATQEISDVLAGR